MPETKKKRRAPVPYRVPKHLEAEFDRRIAESGLSTNAFLTNGWYGRAGYDPAVKQMLAQTENRVKLELSAHPAVANVRTLDAQLRDMERHAGRPVETRAAKGCEILNFEGSYLGQIPLVSAHFWTSDHLSSSSRTVNAFSDRIDR